MSTPRALGRIVLACLLALAVGLVVLPLGLSFAQAPTTIEIVNPNDSSSNVVSDKKHPAHLVAWVNQVPTGARVEFQVKKADGSVVAGPFAALPTTGRPDTFETTWAPDDTTIPEGSYELEVILFKDYTGPGTGTEVDRAKQAIVVNQKDDAGPTTPQNAIAETAEISYPVNGGPLGINYSQTDKTASFLIEGETSANAETVAGYYTLAAPGTDPTFKTCGAAVTPNDQDKFKIRCRVANSDFALGVTGVAVVPNKAGSLPVTIDDVKGAADGHTVTAYRQRPTTVTMEPESRGASPIDTCQSFSVNVKDQNGRVMAGQNVDVHAAGPGETLKFDTGTQSDPSQAPNSNHTESEPGWVCDADGVGGAQGGTQGRHPAAGGAPSIKHIESKETADAVTDGTDNEGNYDFKLYSPANGTTQVTAWADFDEDDQFCSTEPSDTSTIGWGVPAPAAAPEQPTVTSCTVADPSPSPSPTATASGAPTSSPTASGSPTASPTSSPTASPTASPSPDPEPVEYLRTITIGFKDKGKKLVVKGRVKAESGAPEACSDGVRVIIEKKQKGKWKKKAETTTNDKGFYKVKGKDKTGKYRAKAPRIGVGDNDTCSAARKARRHKH